MKIYSAKNPTQAHILAGLLESHGIDVQVQGDGLFSLKGEVPMTTETDPYLWLNDPSQAQQAKHILDAYEAKADAPKISWQCHQCEEEVEGEFEICWQCGAPKPCED